VYNVAIPKQTLNSGRAGRVGGSTTHKRRIIDKDLSEREELQKTSVVTDGSLSSILHYEVFSTSAAGRRKV
jgi:hypothetical protein